MNATGDPRNNVYVSAPLGAAMAPRRTLADDREALERETATVIGKMASLVEQFMAERDAARAVIAELNALVQDSPAKWSTSVGVDIIVLEVEKREFDAIIAKATA